MLGFLTAVLLPFAPGAEPQTPSPRLQFVTMTDRGELLATFVENETVTVSEIREANVDGKVVQIAVNVQKIVPVEKKATMDTKGMKVSTVGGKEVKNSDLPGLLKNGAVVILATEGEKIDAAYLQAFKDGTLILTMPKPTSKEPAVAPRVEPK